MTWRTVFKIYQKQEKEEKEKLVSDNQQQVSQFTLFLPCEGIKKSDGTYAKKILDHIDMKKLKAFLGEDWDDYKNNPESLALWAYLLFKNHLIDQGIAPDNFTATTWCNLCGYVYVPPELTNGGNVLGCPWCWNRVKGLPIIADRKKDGRKNRTINFGLQIVRHILNLAASEWMDDNGLTWLNNAPKIKLLSISDARKPYPLNWEEQERLFKELPLHLRQMALFTVNTGCRDQEICTLRWEWEMKVPELNTSVFIIELNADA